MVVALLELHVLGLADAPLKASHLFGTQRPHAAEAQHAPDVAAHSVEAAAGADARRVRAVHAESARGLLQAGLYALAGGPVRVGRLEQAVATLTLQNRHAACRAVEERLVTIAANVALQQRFDEPGAGRTVRPRTAQVVPRKHLHSLGGLRKLRQITTTVPVLNQKYNFKLPKYLMY